MDSDDNERDRYELTRAEALRIYRHILSIIARYGYDSLSEVEKYVTVNLSRIESELASEKKAADAFSEKLRKNLEQSHKDSIERKRMEVAEWDSKNKA